MLFLAALFSLTQIVLPSDPHDRAKFAEDTSNMRIEPGCRCWWPTWSSERAFGDLETVKADGRLVTVSLWEREHRVFTVSDGRPADLRVATWYYPYWHANVDGTQVPVGKDEFGTIQIPVKAGPTRVELEFVEPFFLSAAKVVSAITWVSLLIVFAAIAIRLRKNPLQLATV